MGKAEKTRGKLLDAGRRIALDEGAAQLTLDQVAERAGVSKGGVLYHFGSKSALLEALVTSFLDDFEQAVQDELKRGAPNWLTAYIRASFPERRAAQLRETSALFAILALQPELLQLARDRFEGWHRAAQADGHSPLKAGLIRSAIDGLWYNEMFGLSLPDEERNQLLRHLEEMALDSP